MAEGELPALSDWLLKKLKMPGQSAEDHLMFLRVERLLGASKAVLDGAPASLASLRTAMSAIENGARIPPADQGSLL